MKIPALLLPLALSGCAVPAAVETATAAIPVARAAGGTVTLEGTRALVIAHNAYQGAAAALVPLVEAGAFDAGQLARIRALSDRAAALLDGADSTLTAAERAARVLTVVDQLNRIAGR